MSVTDKHGDLPGAEELTLVIEPIPSIQVFVAKNEQISISVTAMSDDTDSITRDLVQIPIKCAREVGEALIAIAEKYRA